MENKIRIFALQNAVHFNGKASKGAVVGKTIAEFPDVKKDMKTLMQKINSILTEVNNLSFEQQIDELKKIDPSLLHKEEKKEKREGLKPLPNAEKGKVIMRFEPSPSGPMHIGHAYTGGINAAYCQMYDGKLFLRISDTNPDNIYPDAYDLLPEDARWLWQPLLKNPIEVLIQSERMELYYDYAKRAIEKGAAYVCTCNADDFRNLKNNKKPCLCRDLSVKAQLVRWDKMFSEYKEGDAVVRFKTDIEHKNPAMRDFPILRINESPHSKQGNKYRVWPLMMWAVAVDDMETNITHVIRAKDHMDNAKKQKYIYKLFEKDFPETIFVGVINFTDLKLSCSTIRKCIENNEYCDWGDVRLPFIPALRKRGYQPQVFTQLAIQIGVTQNDKTMSGKDYFKNLDALNKDIIDSTSKRLFFIHDPIKIEIEDAPPTKIELDYHPENEKGGRILEADGKFIIEKSDCDKINEGDIVRLMDCMNVQKKDGKLVFHSLGYEEFKDKGNKIIHWLPNNKTLIKARVISDCNEPLTGVTENNIAVINEGDIIQFERFGFCRLFLIEDSVYHFYYLHR